MNRTVQSTEKSGKVTVINIEGPLTSESSSHFEGLIQSLLAEGNYYIAVNLGQVDFISSAGIGAVLFSSRLVRQRGGNLAVFGASKETISLFSILNLTKSVIMVPDRKEAVRFLTREISGNTGQPAAPGTEQNKREHQNTVKKSGIENENGGIIFNNPLIIECAECGSFIRVHQSGDYICPSCHTEFLAKDDGSVVF